MQKSIGTENQMRARHMVPSVTRKMIPVGMEISSVESM